MKLSILHNRTSLAALLSLTAFASLSSLPAVALGDVSTSASTLSSELRSYDDGDLPPVCFRKPYLPQCGE
jgi:hypothetical protein